MGSSHPLICNSNNKIAFFSYIFSKDCYGFLLLLIFYFLQIGFGILVVSHPDNALEVNILLKPIPDKNTGINILCLTIILFFMSDSFGFVTNSISIGVTIYFLIWICFMWVGAEIPKVNFICLC